MFSTTKILLAGLAASAGLGQVAAITMSDNCKSSLLGLVRTPEVAQCLNVGGAISAFIQETTSTTGDVIAPITSWTQGMCAAPRCSNDAISAAFQNITTGCSAEIGQLPTFMQSYITTNEAGILQVSETAYATLRQIMCLQDTSSGDLCVNDSLNALKGAIGEAMGQAMPSTLTASSFLNLATTIDVRQLASWGQKNVQQACTSCAHGAYSAIRNAFPAIGPLADAEVANTCGASFTDGTTPKSVLVVANNGTASAQPKNGAVKLGLGLSAAAPALLAVSAGFALFA